jgi:hypothetical protein
MSSVPGEVPEFNIDLGPEKTYAPEVIADKIMWPVVDAFWHGNWREDSIPKQEFTFPKVGQHNGAMLDVELNADCELSEDMISRSVSLAVEEILTGDIRAFTLARIKQQYEQEVEEWEDNDEEDADEWPEGDEERFIIRCGVGFTFEEDGNWYINLYHAVEGPYERLVVYPNDADNSPEDLKDMSQLSQRIREHDLEMMEVAFEILGAPEEITHALQEVRVHPQTNE